MLEAFTEIVWKRDLITYARWEEGPEHAIQLALACTLGVYQDNICEDSEFYHFGRCDELGVCLARENKDRMPPYAIKLERMDIYVDFLEASMNALMGHIKSWRFRGPAGWMKLIGRGQRSSN